MTRFHYASTKDPDMLYVVQHAIADSFFFLEHEGKKMIFLPSTDIDAYKDAAHGEVEVVDVGPLRSEASKRPGDTLGNLALVILETYSVKEDIHVPHIFPVHIADFLREKLLRLIAVQEWCPERVRKSPVDISAIKENVEHTKKAFELIEQILSTSVITDSVIINDNQPLTSEFLKREVSKLLLDYDLHNTEGLIISSGKHAAMPHHSGTGLIRPCETIVVDIFPQSSTNHYFADMTRTYVKGEPSDEARKMYAAVKEGHEASLRALRPGLPCREVYEVSAQIIRDHGFDVGEKGYTHSLGHGLGVAIHEAPNLSLRSEAVLEPGHVVTIEPGLYYPEIGGVRIEDTVVITEDGYENLTNYPQNWLIQ